MRIMKTLLRLLGAVSLTTVAVNSIVACGTQADFFEVTGTTGAVRTLLTTSDGTVYVGTKTSSGKSSAGKVFKNT